MLNSMGTVSTSTALESITIRPGSAEDSYNIFLLFEESLADLARQMGSTEQTSFSDPEALARMWEERQPIYEHLAKTADQFWIAERDNQVVGYARSIIRDDLQELTELFVSPKHQSAGLGRILINRAFPMGPAKLRTLISSPDVRAQSLYMKAGLLPQFPLYYFWRNPEKVEIPGDLAFQPVEVNPDILETLAAIDLELLGHQRDVDHSWFLVNRQGYLYIRDGQPVGYGYLGKRNGPFGLLNDQDFPAVLSHAENEAFDKFEHFGVEVPTVNHAAIGHLVSREFRLESFVATLMSNRSFGRFDRYIVTSPPFFL